MSVLKKIKEYYFFQPKSKIKAGEGQDRGDYPFYTSSLVQNKWINKFLFNTQALVIGTGGRASIHYAEGKFSVSTDCYVLTRKQEAVNIKYTYYYLNFKIYLLENGFKGVGLKHISKEYIENIEINYPDLDTQNKIVTILDKAKTIVDKRARSLVMHNELLRAVFINMFGDPVINPMNWDSICLGEIGEWKTGGTPLRNRPEYFMGNIPWCTSGELNDLYISTTNENITQDAVDNSNAKLIPPDSFLIGMYDTAALKSSINTIPMTCNQAIAFASINEQKCDLLYLYTVLRIGKEFYKRTQRGGRQQNLNLTMIKEIRIPLPPIKLQYQFGLKLKKMYGISIKLSQYISLGNSIIKSLSQQVFNDRLTIDVDAELEALIHNISLEKEDSVNNIDIISSDITLIQRLIDRLVYREFEAKNQYDKAKYILFRILKDEPDLIKQIYKDNNVQLTLQNETT